ncbi:MAG: hypothetical protein LZF60_420061 [Nitrospira sp.]|nr:MAG: hypothetical protein LZF60_420061 [Nitrospira sp.]
MPIFQASRSTQSNVALPFSEQAANESRTATTPTRGMRSETETGSADRKIDREKDHETGERHGDVVRAPAP